MVDSDEVEELTLQEPNGKVWRNARDALEKICREDDDGTAIVLTGGAILGARWQHRFSNDVDVQLRRVGSFVALRPEREHGARLDVLMRDIGGTRKAYDEIQIKYEFAEGQMDLLSGPLFPTHCGTMGWVDGEEAEIASTGQIIGTKVRARGRRAPVRDLFDIVVAQREDPKECAAGINAIPARELEDIEAIWLRSAEAFAKEATTLREPAAKYSDILSDPAGKACAALRALTWRQIDLEYTPQGAQLVGTRADEREVLRNRITTRHELDDAIITHGAYDDPMRLRYEQEGRFARIERALRGESVASERVKTVELSDTRGRALARGQGEQSSENTVGLKPLENEGTHEHTTERTAAGSLVTAAMKAGREGGQAEVDVSRRANEGIASAAQAKERGTALVQNADASRTI